MRASSLNAWMNGEFVGTWSVQRGTHRFTYADSWLQSAKARSISLSIPISAAREATGPAVAHYFDNLLPDNDQIRDRIRRRFGTASTEAFDLLSAIGRDCVGAVQLLPEGMEPRGFDQIEIEALSETAIEAILKGVPSDTVLGQRADDDLFRISIAGAQEKTALVQLNGAWFRPHGATPTTHILKLPLGLIGNMRIDMTDSVENEWLCAQIVEAFGLPVGTTTIATFGDQKVLVVERFDRELMGHDDWIARLPQEDLCQAYGIAPRAKYEKDGGPGIAQGLALLSGSELADADRTQFVMSQFVFWLLGATDGHAKNFSIFLNAGDAYALTPLYDVLSAWPIIGNGPNMISPRQAALAMALKSKNVHYRLHEIQTRHWHQLAVKSGVPQVWSAMRELIERIDAALDGLESRLPEGFPPRLWERVAEGVRGQAGEFERGMQGV